MGSVRRGSMADRELRIPEFSLSFKINLFFRFSIYRTLMEIFSWRLRSGFYLRHEILNTQKVFLWERAWGETIQKAEGSGSIFTERKGFAVDLSPPIGNLSSRSRDYRLVVLQSTSSYRHRPLSTGIGFLFAKGLMCKCDYQFSVVSLHKPRDNLFYSYIFDNHISCSEFAYVHNSVWEH
jgi:hypothetical protein